jgi:hypothetical protein
MAEEDTGQTTDQTDQTDQTDNRDYETEARRTGWRPKTDYQGVPDKWIDAKSWVERGETYIPFIRAENHSLKTQIEARDSKLTELDRQLKLANKAISELKEMTTEQAVSGLEDRKNELIEQIAAAHEGDDIRKELKLRDELSDVNEEIRKTKRNASTETRGTVDEGTTRGTVDEGSTRVTQPKDDPIFQGWVRDNRWMDETSSDYDPEMAGAAVARMAHLINSDPEFKKLPPRERLDIVARYIKNRFGSNEGTRRRPNKVLGSKPGDSTGSARGKGYDDLPQSARDQCDAFAKRFVGKRNGRGEVKYKTVDEYRAQYTRDYFAEDWGQQHMNAT